PAELHQGSHSEIVLVVEDEERVRGVSVEALRHLGYTVVSASDPIEALALLEQGQPVSLLFTDMIMPNMTGRELAERARKKLPKLKVLYTTGYRGSAHVHDKALEGGASVLKKPFSIDDLAAMARRVLDN